MSELSVQTGAFLANLLKVEDAQIVSSASAGIAQSVAALIEKAACTTRIIPIQKRSNSGRLFYLKGTTWTTARL